MKYNEADKIFEEYEEKEIEKLLFGHSIVEVRDDSDSLILDDGTELQVVANEG